MWIGQGKYTIPGNLDLFSQYKRLWFKFLVNLKVQSTRYGERRLDRISAQFLSVKIVKHELQNRLRM